MYIYNNENDRWMDYTVTNTENRFNGYVEDNKGRRFEFTRPCVCEREIPVYRYPCGKRKSIYKRSFLNCRRDEYNYLYTDVTDVYYNYPKDRFLKKTYTYSY